MKKSDFIETTGSVARKAECGPDTVRAYADSGLLEFIRLPNGMRAFRADAVQQVRDLKTQRLANRGGARRGLVRS